MRIQAERTVMHALTPTTLVLKPLFTMLDTRCFRDSGTALSKNSAGSAFSTAQFLTSGVKDVYSNKGLKTPLDIDRTISDLCKRANGLFIWAATTIRFISDSNPYDEEDIQATIEKVLLHPNDSSTGMHELYRTVLESSGIEWGNKKATADGVPEKGTPDSNTPAGTPARGNSDAMQANIEPKGRVPAIAVVLGAVASIGGFMFGYESGQISGFLEMSDFKERFGDDGQFSAVRQGAIVGLLA